MRFALRLTLALAVLALATRAEAIPAFARKYGLSCTACHVAWPILNQQGQLFRDSGYQFGTEKDDPVTISQAYVPISLRTTPAYGYTRTTNQPSDGGAITVASGGVPAAPAADLLTAGTIAKDLSFLLVVAGFAPPDEAAAIESAFLRVDNLGGSGWANLKIGKFELDLPASSHRGVSLTGGYAAYGPRSGSAVALDLGENQVGLELDGHDARGATRYAVALVSANGDPGGKGVWTAPLIYLHAQQALETGSALVPWIRVGVLGAVGWWPTSFKTDGGAPIAGTGGDYKTYERVGGELTGLLGYPSSPLQWQVAYLYGAEAEGASGPGSPKAHFSGGWAEVDWVPMTVNAYNATPWLVFGRFDLVRQGEGPGDFDGFTLGARRYLAIGPRASAAVHLEVSSGTTKGAGADGGSVQAQALLAGIDFAF
jgi:hypothetical protein